MNLDLYRHERGFLIVARNKFGESAEYISTPGDGIWEYVDHYGRLNMSFIVYHLTTPPKGRKLDKEAIAFLDFLNRANDHRHPRRVLRPDGWRDKAGISRGEVISAPKKPGDVTVHGDCARAYVRVMGEL